MERPSTGIPSVHRHWHHAQQEAGDVGLTGKRCGPTSSSGRRIGAGAVYEEELV